METATFVRSLQCVLVSCFLCLGMNGVVTYGCNMLQRHFVPGKLNVLWAPLRSKILRSLVERKKKRKKNSFPRHSFAKAWETSAFADMYWSALCLSPRSSVSSEGTAAAKRAVLLQFLSASTAAFGFFRRPFLSEVSQFPLKITFSSAETWLFQLSYVVRWRRN